MHSLAPSTAIILRGLENILGSPIRRRRHIRRLHEHLKLPFRARIRRIGSIHQSSIRVSQLVAAIADFIAVLRVVDEVLVIAIDCQTPEAKGPDRWLAGEGEEVGCVWSEGVGAEGGAVPAGVEGYVGDELVAG